MTSQNPKKLPFSITINLLEAYETKTPPPGSKGTYPVGHTVLQMRMENFIEQPLTLEILAVQIISWNGKQVLMEKAKTTNTQVIDIVELGGLQIQERGMELTNNHGFSNYEKVSAVVVYRYRGKRFIAKSADFTVSFFP